MYLYKHLLTLLLLCVLTACTSTPDIRISEPDWEIAGKIGIREPQRSTSLLFNWQQQQDRYVIHLLNTLGQIQLTLTGDQHHALAISPDGKKRRAATPEILLLDMTGWHFPLQSARYWLQGQTDNPAAAATRDNSGKLTALASGEWQVAFSQYKPVGAQQLPHHLQLQHDSDPLRLTLLIKTHAAFTP